MSLPTTTRGPSLVIHTPAAPSFGSGHFGPAHAGLLGLSSQALDAPSAEPATGPSRPTGPAAFTGVTREDVYREADLRRGPGAWQINQGRASLCGPACLMYATATRRPDDYVRFVTTLFEKGDASLGNLRVRPGEDCRKRNPGTDVAAADWVALAGLRDSENAVFDYDEPDDQLAGITLPGELESWLRRAGATEIANETNLYLRKSRGCFLEAASRFTRGEQVFLFINADALSGEVQSRGAFSQIFTTPNHWVVLRDVLSTRDESVKIDVYTWGEQVYHVPHVTRSTMTMNAWLQNFYGYIACKM